VNSPTFSPLVALISALIFTGTPHPPLVPCHSIPDFTPLFLFPPSPLSFFSFYLPISMLPFPLPSVVDPYIMTRLLYPPPPTPPPSPGHSTPYTLSTARTPVLRHLNTKVPAPPLHFCSSPPYDPTFTKAFTVHIPSGL